MAEREKQDEGEGLRSREKIASESHDELLVCKEQHRHQDAKKVYGTQHRPHK